MSPEYEGIGGNLAGEMESCPQAQEEFALETCPAYVPKTAPGRMGGGGGVEGEGLYVTVSSA